MRDYYEDIDSDARAEARAELEAEARTRAPACAIQYFNLAEWPARELPPRDFLLGDWLHTDSRVLVDGATGAGKSLFAMEAAFCASQGLPFLHWPAGRPCHVLYIDGEMGATEMRERIISLHQRYNIQFPQNLTALCTDDSEEWRPIDSEEGRNIISNICDELKVELVVLDNLMCLAAGSLKEEETWGGVKPLSLELSKRRVAQIWLHHTGHDGSRFYGASPINWGMTANIHLDKIKGQTLQFKLSIPKARGKREATKDQYADVQVTFDGSNWECSAGIARKKPVREISPRVQRLMPLIAQRTHGSTTELARAFGVPDSKTDMQAYATQQKAFRRALMDVQKAGLIEVCGDEWCKVSGQTPPLNGGQ